MIFKSSSHSKVIKKLNRRLKQFKSEETAKKLIKNASGLSKQILYILELSWFVSTDGFKIFVDPESKEIIDIIYFYTILDYKEEPLGAHDQERLRPYLEALIDV